MPRCLLLRAADELTGHPGPSTVALQWFVGLCLIDAMFAGIRAGRKLWPR